MTEIKLLGVTHGDLSVAPRVRNALTIERPTVITIEVAPGDLRFLTQSNSKSVVENEMAQLAYLQEEARRLLRQVAYFRGQEFLVPIDFAAMHGIQLHCIDDPAFSKYRNDGSGIYPPETIRMFKDRAVVEKLLADQPFEKQRMGIDALYGIVSAFQRDPQLERETAYVQNVMLRVLRNNRDAVPAMKLSQLCKRTNGKIVHVCGAGHTLDDVQGRTLYSKLKQKHLPVSRTTAKDYDIVT